MSNPTEAKCPFNHTFGGGTSNKDWWPKHLPLDLLHQHSSRSDPMDAFKAIRKVDALARDIKRSV